jgi:DNA repair protein RadC
VVNLDARNRVLGVETVYRGNVNETKVRSCEVFRSAIRASTAAAIIAAHNHPSGDCSPSPEDLAVNRVLVQSGELLGIEVLDHIIVANGRFTSMRERGLGF